ncbi:MAG TPA: hypothetical protein VF400_02060, partial [Anaeromyxobacteraceae bacterium]
MTIPVEDSWGPGGHGVRTEGASPERRLVLRVVEVINVGFLAVDLAIYGPHNFSVLCGRALVSAGLLASDVAL